MKRMHAILTYKQFAAMIAANPTDKKALELNKDKLKEFVLLEPKSEKKFFTILNMLTKHLGKKFLNDLQQYKYDGEVLIIAYQEKTLQEMKDFEPKSEDYEHKSLILNRIKHITQKFG